MIRFLFFLEATTALDGPYGWKQHYRKLSPLCQAWYFDCSEDRFYWHVTGNKFLSSFQLVNRTKHSTTIAPL